MDLLIPIIVGIIILLALMFFLVRELIKSTKYKKYNQQQAMEFYSWIEDNSFRISKKIDSNEFILLIDDINKRWAYLVDDDFSIYDYSDFASYKIIENDASAVNGVASNTNFGSSGMSSFGGMVTPVCINLQLRVKLNDLQNPEVVFTFINSRTRKSSDTFQIAFNLVNEMAAIFDYIKKSDGINESKVCPMCAESVKSKARVCRFCGYKFDNNSIEV